MKKILEDGTVYEFGRLGYDDTPKIKTVCRMCGGTVGYDTDEEFCQECKDAVEFVKAIIKVSKGY